MACYEKKILTVFVHYHSKIIKSNNNPHLKLPVFC